MTGAHRKTMRDACCECGHDNHSLHRLLYHCPLSHPALHHVARCGREVPSRSTAPICPCHLGLKGVKTWEDTCMRAVRAISRMAVSVESIDWKGHEVTTSPCNSLGHCGKCWVARKVRDMKYLHAKHCANRDFSPCWHGDHTIINGYVARCETATWKRAGLRCALEWGPELPPSLRHDVHVVL